MICILRAVLLVATVVLCETSLLLTKVTTSKDFVDVLKHKLRKNNDDYDELSLANTTTSNLNRTTFGQQVFTRNQDSIPAIKLLDLRRSFRERHSDDEHATTHRNVKTISRFTKTTIKNVSKNYTGNTNNTIAKPYFRSKHKYENKEKMDKFKKFMNKNKNLLNDFLNKKLIAHATKEASMTPMTTRATATTAVTGATTTYNQSTLGSLSTVTYHAENETAPNKSEMKLPTKPDGIPTKETFGLNLRAHLDTEEMTMQFPKHNLDMAPAKGSKIHVMRLKGRLCQRNVMLPEGPKYDSRGRMYLGAFTHKFGRDYSRTRRPKLVLPRCCNCCKKSVLGCE